MQIRIQKRLPSSQENGLQLVFLFEDGRLNGVAKKINTQSSGLLQELYARGDFSGQSAQTLLLHRMPGVAVERVLLVGLGARKTADMQRWRAVCHVAARLIADTKATTLLSDVLVSVKEEKLDTRLMAEQLVRELISGSYTFTLHNTAQNSPTKGVERIIMSAEAKLVDTLQMAADRGHATAMGMSIARDLGNLAPNICTPDYLCATAAELSDKYDNLSHEILDEDAMSDMGMGALLAVSQGSEQPARLICMHYRGRKRAGAPVILVGKGITFDTGGISIKPSDSLDEMKFDMCGAASVFGVIEAVARLQLNINLIGVVAAAENMPDGKACRPGDVVTSMSGQTIEILNTDAEGRLVLCDALTYVERYKPSVVIDLATLTGACVVALGKSRSGIMGNHQETIDQIIDAGNISGDRTWQLPIGDDYQGLLDSNFADMANIGGRPAGAITAACFLSRFAGKYRWAHLDIAGIASISGKDKGSTGRPVPLLMSYLFSQVDS
ncbi:MAG: leucyl aminopeptidase [Granulosicoccus sp.]